MKCLRAFSVAFYAGLPVERRNWMDNPKPEFLWVFAADKTPLLHKHSPSCSNRFANLILKHFSVPIVAQTSWRGPRAYRFRTSWPSAAFAVQRKTQESSVAYWKVIFIYWTSLECQYFSWWHIGSCLHCLRWSNLSNCSLLKPNMIRKKFLFPLPACFCGKIGKNLYDLKFPTLVHTILLFIYLCLGLFNKDRAHL